MPQTNSNRPLRNLTDSELRERKNRSSFGANTYDFINPAHQPPLLIDMRDAIYNRIKNDELSRQLWDDAAGVFNGLTKPLTRAQSAEGDQYHIADMEEFYRKRERKNPNRYGITALGGSDRAPVRPTPLPQQVIKNQYDKFLDKNLPKQTQQQVQMQMLLNALQGKY